MKKNYNTNPQYKQSLTILLEAVWWFATVVLVLGLIYPIYKFLPSWPFLSWNITFIVVLVTFTRYIFLLQHTFLAKRQVLKIVFLLLMFPLTFILVSGLHGFMNFIEERTWDPLTGMLPPEEKLSMENYIWQLMIFFGVGSIVSAPVLAVRLFLSVWRTRNRGTA